MVQCGEDTNAKMGITREEQDDYAKQSYKRAMKAYSEGVIQQEMFDVTIPGIGSFFTSKNKSEFIYINLSLL